MQELTIKDYNSKFNELYPRLKDNIYIKSDSIVHTIKDSILTTFMSANQDKSDLNDLISSFSIGENYTATEESLDVSKVVLVMYFIIGGYNGCSLNNQVKKELKDSSFGYNTTDIISDLLSIESNEDIAQNDISVKFYKNTGLKIRDMDFTSYIKSSLYIEDLNTISRLFSDDYQSLAPYLDKINSTVDSILSVYDSLFESGFDLVKPLGVFDEKFFYHVKDKKLIVEELFDANGNPTVSIEKMFVARKLGSAAYDFRGSDSYSFDFEGLLLSDVANCVPKLLLSFALGCSPSDSDSYVVHPEYGGDWKKYKENKIRPYLTNTIFKQCTDIYLKQGKQYTDILKMYDKLSMSLKRCCLALEWDTKLSVKLRVFTPDSTCETHPDFRDDLFFNIFDNVGEVVDNSSGNLLDVKMIKDVKAYNFEPIFAYQALDALQASNRMPSWENVILGRKANDKTFTYDFSQYQGYHVVAASRSGKGVMCLNILAAALGSGYPVFYLDSKPDMARTIKDICSQSVVCTGETIQGLGIMESDFLKNIPEDAKKLLGDTSYINYGGIVYLKLLQLAFLVAELRYQVKENGMCGITQEELGIELDRKSGNLTYSKLIVFVDELEKATVHLNDSLKICLERSEPFKATKKEIKDNVTDDGNILSLSPNAPSYALLADRIVNWESKLASEISLCGKATLGKARMHLMYIYQAYNQPKGSLDHKYEHIFEILKSLPSTANIIGANAEYYPEAASKIPQISKNLTRDKRWFSLSTVGTPVLEAQVRTLDAIKTGGINLFKPYLMLNDSDINAPCVREFLDDNPERIRRFTVDGAGGELISSRIGFKSYVDSMLKGDNSGHTTESLLSKGNNIALAVVSKLGYTSVNDYLFDFSIDSFRSITELVGLISKGVSVRDSSAVSDLPVTPDFSFSSKSIVETQAPNFEDKPQVSDTQSADSTVYDIFSANRERRINTERDSEMERQMELKMLEARATEVLSRILAKHPDWRVFWTKERCDLLISCTVQAFKAQGGN